MPYRDPQQKKVNTAKYYAENREKLAAINVKYRAENREKIKAHKAKHYKENREKILVGRAKYYKENRENVLTQREVYYENNIEKLKAKNAQYARSPAGRAAAAQTRATLRATIINRLGGCCVRCSSVDNLEFDHIHDNGNQHRKQYGGQGRASHYYRWMRDAPISEVLHGKYAIQLLCNECHRTKDKWSQKPDLFFKEAA